MILSKFNRGAHIVDVGLFFMALEKKIKIIYNRLMENSIKRISVHCHPFEFEKGQHILEKVDKGIKRKYLRGVSSGIMVDGHGERITLKGIESMHNQAESGDILLYKALHGVDFSEDIGILVNSEIIHNRDWFTEYRLYDEMDFEPGCNKLQSVGVVWRQLNGIKPYKKKAEKGFSIEGIIPDDAIVDAKIDKAGNMMNRVIDDVLLDGVVLVNRPAYTESFALAVTKALGELLPNHAEILKKSFSSLMYQKLQERQETDNFYDQFWSMRQVLEDQIHEIMKRPDTRNREKLNILTQEYSALLIELVMKYSDIFIEEVPSGINPIVQNSQKVELMLKMASTMKLFGSILEKRTGGKYAQRKVKKSS